MSKYSVIAGMAFHPDTSEKVIDVLVDAYRWQKRIKLYLGDPKTGKDWHEEHDTIGRVGRSTGDFKIPLLIKTSRSHGGGAILDHCIVKIVDTKSKAVLYQNDAYIPPTIIIEPIGNADQFSKYKYNLFIDAVYHSCHKTLRSAQLLKNKLS